MEEKIVRLFNGKHTVIRIKTNDNISYFVDAFDLEGYLVGSCNFSITRIYSRSITEEQRAKISAIRKIPIESIPSEREVKITKSNYEKYKDSIDGDILTLETGNKFKFKNNFCDLAVIDVLDEKFYKVGLGSAMWEEMQKIAKQHNCTMIKGHFHPHGRFQDGTSAFYRRRGCSFVTENGQTNIIKALNLPDLTKDK